MNHLVGTVTADVDAFEVRNKGKSAAIAGKAPRHIGVFGFSETSHGVQGVSKSEIGVLGSTDGTEDFNLNLFCRGVQGYSSERNWSSWNIRYSSRCMGTG